MKKQISGMGHQARGTRKNCLLSIVCCLLPVACCLLPTVCLYAANEIYVTQVEKSPLVGGGAVKEIATIVLNNCIKVKEIQVIKVGGSTSFKYPTYTSKKGKEFPQFVLLTKQAKDEIEKAVITGKSSANPSKQISYKISKFSKFGRQSSLKAFCAVDFNNAVRIECKVMESGRGPWVSWPARKPEEGGKWVKQILITNKKLKSAVEKALMDKYKPAKSESSEDE